MNPLAFLLVFCLFSTAFVVHIAAAGASAAAECKVVHGTPLKIKILNF